MSTGRHDNGRALAPGRGRAATWGISVVVLWWVVWLVLILSAPVHPSSVSNLEQSLNRHQDVQWLVVERGDEDLSAKTGHGLVDPLPEHWRADVLLLGNQAVDSAGSGNTEMTDPAHDQIAWSDDDGLHVTQDFRVDASWKPDTNGLPTVTSSPSAEVYRRLSTEHSRTQVDNIRALTPYGEISYGAGPTTLNLFGIVALVAFLVALGFLLSRQPRFRTRWSWFWVFTCPLGVGLIWYVMREGWFGRVEAPVSERKSGWRGFGVSVVLSVVTTPIINYWLFR